MSFDFVVSGYPGVDYIMPVNRAPNPGETGVILSPPPLTSPYLGGCVLNIAVGGARLGLRTAAVALLGGDSAGEHILKQLQSEGVDTLFGIRRIADGHTAVTFLFVDPQNRHQTFYYPGVSDREDVTIQLDASELEDSAWGVITVGNPTHNRHVLETFVRSGLQILWTHKNDAHAFPPSLVQRLAEVSSVVVLNHHEADAVCQILGVQDLHQLLGKTLRTIILTQGAEGSRIITASGESYVPAVRPEAMVDPTGAGDGFTAGLLFGLCRGLSMEESCRVGAVAASFVLEQWGCQTNLPDINSMRNRYKATFGEELLIKGVVE